MATDATVIPTTYEQHARISEYLQRTGIVDFPWKERGRGESKPTIVLMFQDFGKASTFMDRLASQHVREHCMELFARVWNTSKEFDLRCMVVPRSVEGEAYEVYQP